MDRFGKPRNRCSFHPSQAVVGICSSCLRERLVSLARANYEQRKSEIVYKPDPASWGYLRFRKKNFDDVEGARDLDLVARAKPQNDNSSDEKKEGKVNLSGFRSFLGFFRKTDCRNNVSVLERQENRLQRRHDRCADVQDSWEPSVRTKTGCPSSTRRSVSESRLTGRRYSKGSALRRSSTSYHNEMEDTIESGITKKLPNDGEKDEGKLINASDSMARCRSQRGKSGMRDLEIKDSKANSVINDCLIRAGNP